MTIIFSGYGIEIHRRDGKYYIVYDAGEITVEDYEVEVSGEDAQAAMLSSDAAYRVIMKYEASKKRLR